MAEQALVGGTFTFNILFLDALSVPLPVVNNPLITVFHFSQAGVRQDLVSSQPLVPAVPAEDGRYVYTYTLPSSLRHGDVLYGDMTGEDPAVPGGLLRVEQRVVVITAPPSTQGMTARLVY